MTYSVLQVCNHIADLVIKSLNTNREFSDISATENFHSDSLIFVDTKEQLAALGDELPAVIITHLELLTTLQNSGTGLIAVNNVRLAQALVKQKYHDYDSCDSEWPDIHATAVIHKSAHLGRGVHIGANTVVGQHVNIGDNTSIRANCVIERDAVIGEDCVIHNLVNIGAACSVGKRVIIRPGAVIGNEGFGFAQDDQKRHHRIPHTGIVEVHDDVQIGSNTNIDRGTYGKTVISRGVKLDALCHIAHNVFIGEDSVLTAQCSVAGSSRIGRRVLASGQTGVLDHRTIADDVVLVHRCGVTEDINSSGMWAGTPAKPFKEYVKNLNSFQKLQKLEKRIDQKLAKLEKLIDES